MCNNDLYQKSKPLTHTRRLVCPCVSAHCDLHMHWAGKLHADRDKCVLSTTTITVTAYFVLNTHAKKLETLVSGCFVIEKRYTKDT